MDINIYSSGGGLIMTAPITADAVHEEKLMQTDQVNLKWNAATSTTLPAGSFITLNSIRYYLAEDYRPDSKDLGLYTYTPEFLHEVYLLKKMPFLLIDATNNANSIESDWNYTGSLADLCQPLEQAINDALGIDGASPQAYSVQIDSAIENAVSLSFSNMSILDALNAIAEAVNGEWYTDEAINGYTGNHIIHIAPSCLHEGGEGSTLAFTAGNQVGFPQSQQKHEFYNRYYIFGATRNIPQDYNGAQANTVVNKRLTLDPTLHPNGYIDLPQFTEEGEVVTTDDSTKPSFYDENGNVAHYVPDDSLSGRKFVKVVQIDDVYPRANLHVSSIVANTRYVLQDGNKVQTGTDGGGNPVYSTYVVYYVSLQNESDEAFTIDDSTYDPTSNPNGSKIKGLNVSIHFKSGALTGREFEVKYHSAASQKENIDGTKVNIPAGCFEIVMIEDNTVIIPNTNIAPVVDDEVTVFNIRMPQAYITSAYKELDKEAMKAIYEEWRDGNEYEVKSNPESFIQHVYNLHIGRHVKLTAWGRLIDTRITKLQTHLDRDFEQTISFTKGIKKGTISTLLTTIEATSARMTQVELKDDSNLHQLRQQLYTAQRELHDMVFDTEGNYYSDKISPVAIETKLIEVGGKSTQLSVSGLTVMPNVNSALTAKDPDHVKVVSNSGRLVHYGLPDSPRTWNISNNEIDLDNANAYYIYARCVRAEGATACAIVCDQGQHVYNEDETYYYFLIGTISSKISNGNTPPSYDRVVSLMYGSTSISGRFVTTGRIQSVDGNTWFDLDTGELHGNFTFTSAQKEELAADAASRVQVGGRNYLLNSDGSSSANINLHGNATLATLDGVKCVKADQNTASCGYYVSTSQMSSAINGNTTDEFDWVLSVDVYASAANIDCQWGLGYGERETIATVGAWHRLTKTVKSSLKTFVVYKVNNNGTLYFKNWKLERGNVATDWTPAPEDFDASIEETNANLALTEAKAAQAKAAVDSINTDSIFSPSEKNTIKPEWEAISGVKNVTSTITNTGDGSYQKARTSASDAGLTSATEYTTLGTALTSLQSYLRSAELYSGEDTNNFSRNTLSDRLKDYYNAETALWNKISDTLAEQKASAAVANISIGGRNYLLNSDGSSSAHIALHGGAKLVTLNSVKCVQCATDTAASGFYIGTANMSPAADKTNVLDWILSVDVYVLSTSNLVRIGLETKKVQDFVIPTAGKWQRIKVSGNSALYTAICYSISSSTTVYFKNWKLEFGSKATDWTPAPEDVDSAISTAQAAADGAQSAINRMNGDANFSYIEKKAFRSEWININGVVSTDADSATTAGSYKKALAAVGSTGVSTSAITTAYNNLRSYLDGVSLNSNTETIGGFSQQTLGERTAAYYNAETALYNAIADYYAQQVAETIVGRNYFLRSDGSSSDKITLHGNATLATLDGVKCVKADQNTASCGYYVSTSQMSSAINGNTTDEFDWVLSVDVYASAANIDCQWGLGYGERETIATVGAWHRLTKTVKSSLKTFVVYKVNNNGTLYFKNWKLERGTVASAWTPAPEDTDYLTTALAEASANVGGTTVNGGLVLSKFIGVRDNSNNVVAGMTATKDANGNKMPMIFAGAVASNQTLRLGKFQVWENGKIVSTNGTNEVHIDEDYIKFYNSGNLKNVITSASGGGITAMSGKATTSDSTSISPTYSKQDSGSITQGDLQQPFVTKFIAAKTDTITLVASPTKAGTVNIAAGSIKFYTSTVWAYSGVSEATGGAISIKLKSGSTDISTLATGTLSALTDNTTLSWTAKNNIAFAANNVLKLVIQWDLWQVDLDTGSMSSGTTLPYTISRSYQAQGNIAISWALNEYKNTFYADGFFLSAASNKSFGVDPAMADTEQNLFRIQAPTTGTATQTFCMRPKGLGYSAGSSSLFHLNPLALIVRVTWNDNTGKYSANPIYNPRGVTPSANTDGNNCKIFHGLGTIPVTVNVMLISNSRDNRRGGVQVYLGSNFVTVNVGDHANSWRADFDIFFYDYSAL